MDHSSPTSDDSSPTRGDSRASTEDSSRESTESPSDDENRRKEALDYMAGSGEELSEGPSPPANDESRDSYCSDSTDMLGYEPTTAEATNFEAKIYPLPDISMPDIGIKEDLSDWWYKNQHLKDPSFNWEGLDQAIQILRSHSIPPVAFPTETVYGLGANALSEKAVLGIFAAKNRPADNPLIVHIASLRQLRKLLGPVPSVYHKLVSRFWPGPLTIIMPLPIGGSKLAYSVTRGLPTVGIRMPDSFYARLLISLARRPIAAPSANTSGKPSPTTANHVYHDMWNRVSVILDAGPCQVGLESTVIDGTSDPPTILRPGAVSREEIIKWGGPAWAGVRLGYTNKMSLYAIPRAPGMKYRHYAPSGKVILCEAGITQLQASTRLCHHLFSKKADGIALKNGGQRIGVITTATWEPFLGISDARHGSLAGLNYKVYTASDPKDVTVDGVEVSIRTDWPPRKHWPGKFFSINAGKAAEEVGRNIFAALRLFDMTEQSLASYNGLHRPDGMLGEGMKCDIIVVEGIDEIMGDMSVAVMNRLRKAAEG